MADFNVEEILGEIKTKAEDLTKSAISAVEKKANEEKLKFSYSGVEKLKNAQYIEIGKMIYKKYLEGEFSEDMLENLSKIDSLNAEQDSIKARILLACNKKVCSECGEFFDMNLEACPKCGAKV